MDPVTLLKAAVLGIVEGLTEFLPVSSTGHLLLVARLIGFDDPGKTFEVLIQLGAILAILALYGVRLFRMVLALPSDPSARRFAIGVLIAFLPAAVLGLLLHGFIKEVLFESPRLIAVSLIVGGIVLFLVDRLPLRPIHTDATALPFLTCAGIGLAQCLALIPGVSRSGATIVGALMLGVDRRAAAEFSFFLAIPTMFGAFAVDAYQARNTFSFDQLAVTAVGFVTAFITAIVVVRVFLDFVSRQGLTLFAWWRVIVGGIALNLAVFSS
ncbi:MAG: undecaprenyl-diphosphate phosphatase [Bauldia sp.]